MPSVKELKVELQNGSGNTYFASWKFNETTKSTTTSTKFKVGDLVKIKAGSKYYNGVDVPDWVENYKYKWYISQLSGNRAVLGKSQDGKYNIQSPIDTKYLTGGSSSSSSSSSTVSSKTLDYYTVKWYYSTGNGVWFTGGSSDKVEETKYTFSPPDNSVKIKVSVKPIAKKYKSGNSEKSHWTGTWKSVEYSMSAFPPKEYSVSSVAIDKYELTATVNIGNDQEDSRTDKIQFQIYNGDEKFNTGTADVKAQRAIYTCSVKAGGKYRVRCRAVNVYNGKDIYGEWSDFTSETLTAPDTVTNVKCGADSETSVKLTWDASETAKGYEIEYTTKEEYFDHSSEVSSTTTESTMVYITGLESGQTWYFRVRATNDAQDPSGWSEIISSILGTKPEAPTTWSLTTTAIVGEDIVLYWVHNSEDGSKQTKAEIQLDINGSIDTIEVPGVTTDDDEEEPIYSYRFNSSEYIDGAKILWKVRTKGVVDSWSEWSNQRQIDLYAPPTLQLSLSTNENEVLTSFPLDISVMSGPNAQKPISYHVSIVANESYESVDVIGSDIYITSGTELYSKVFINSNSEFSLSLSAGDVLLEPDRSYKLTVTVSMDSGLTAKAETIFSVDWDDYSYLPDASIGIDFDNLSAYIAPFCIDEEDNLVDNVTLSVYRREYDGTFTELATGIENSGSMTVTDPHPSLDYARYRIVSLHTDTGAIGYEDLPGEPINETSIIIQWDEDWINFDYSDDAIPETPAWTGSIIRLPYNVDVAESKSNDVSLIGYIGREHPVSYYGTQRSESGNWSAVIDKTDKELIYALRRLAAWRGNAYVREPSGVGYWANVSVSMPIKHLDPTIPVSLTVTRVEGGI